ncbi:hypothetical protein ACFRFJ_17055 [Streptomyces hydrogenans]|uniref:hypothetical protein n=1 Tax=Streptomyces hydrogenans TaxID=1873719 RepID=UPI0036BA1BB7
MAITVGSVEVDIVPSAQGFQQRLSAALVPPANQVGQQIGQIIGQQIAHQISGSVQDGITAGGRQARPAAARQGSETAGAFARSMRARLEQAYRSMPRLDVRLSTTGVDADLARLRARMETLSNRRIGIDVDTATAAAEITDIEERLRRIGAAHPDISVRADTAAARAALAEIRQEIDRVSADPARIRVETDGTFGQRLRAAVQAAEASLPEINITADSTAAEVQIARLRAQLTSLRDARIGVDIDAATATAQLAAIQAQLQALSASDADIAVRVDAGAAVTQLAAVQAMVSALDGRRVNIRVDTSGATSALLQLGVAIGGVAALPAIPVIAAGIGAITSAAVVAAGSVAALGAVAVPAFMGIAKALQAQKAAQDAATNSSLRGGQAAAQAANQAQSRALQMAGAQQALATAERNGARQIEQAQDQVRQARRATADAAEQAAEQNARALRAIADAEDALVRSQEDAIRVQKDLTRAQEDLTRSQEDLTRARQEAADQLEDMQTRLSGAEFSQRDAALSVKEAELELQEVKRKGSKATQLEIDRAQLSYDQAVARLENQTNATEKLRQETAAAAAAGVEGSDVVRDAQERLMEQQDRIAEQQERLAQAQEDVQDKTEAVAQAQADAARTQIKAAEQVARAQERVGEATENVAVAQQAAADAVASAQRQIQSASIQTAGSVDQAAIAQAKYRDALADLTPAARDTMDSFVSLKDAFGEWSKALQPAVMPIFTRALEGIKNALPGITPIVLAAAEGIERLQDRASRGFDSPWWKSFKADFTDAVIPAIEGVGTAFGNVFVGMAGIMQAFFPHMDSISSRMESITGRFADWGSSLKGSPEFEGFLAYAAEAGPTVARALGDIGGGLLSVAKALEPLSGPLLTTVGTLFSLLGEIAETLPWLIQGFYAWWIITRILTLAMMAFSLVASANPFTLIVLAVLAVVAVVVYCYQEFEWFRDIVAAVWKGIQDAAIWAWQNVLKPIFDGIVLALRTVGDWAVWLWLEILKPTWDAIVLAAQILITGILTILVLPFVLAFQLIAEWATILWENYLSPIFSWIADKARWLWIEVLQPAWEGIKEGMRQLGEAAMVLWRQYISPVFSWIADKARWLWREILKPVWDLIKAGFRQLGEGARSVWNDYISPVFKYIGDKATWLWKEGLKPSFDKIKEGVREVGKSFETAKDFIGRMWTKVSDIAKVPVRFVIDKVYNGGIVPTWNLIAGAFGAPEIKKMDLQGWATGGVLPGYTPGRDVHTFVSPTGGGLELSGGEAIMRPEWTRAVGAGFVNSMNHIAASRGSTGVKQALAPALGGNPNMPTEPVQRFASGGIFSWIGSKVAGVGTAAWEKAKGAAEWIKEGLGASARAGLETVVDPLLAAFPGADTSFGRMIRRIPHRIVDSIFGYSDEADRRGADTIGGPRIKAALSWARTQNGLPYEWGGNGNPSWDCSGFLSAIESVIRGQAPHRRWATMAFSGDTAPPGWVRGADSPYVIGITNSGVGHTAGTLGGVNVESRGGDGVIVGPRARGANSALFSDVYGFVPAASYDSGGYLQPGLNFAFNGTGKPEPVMTTGQLDALARTAQNPGLDGLELNVYLADQPVRDIARAEVRSATGQLIQVLNAGGGR